MAVFHFLSLPLSIHHSLFTNHPPRQKKTSNQCAGTALIFTFSAISILLTVL